MSANRHWSKFWWQDWGRDINLRICSLAAQGLWMRLLCIAHEGTPVGHVTINGQPPSTKQLANIIGAKAKDIDRLLAELEENGVFSKTEDGVIYSRRMVRDERISQAGREVVQRRWGPTEADRKSRTKRMAEARRRGTHTPEEWSSLLEVCGNCCTKCGGNAEKVGEIVRDHIVPIYRNGSDAIDNIQPLCRSCNAGKGDNSTDYRPTDWKTRLAEALKTPREVPRGVPRSTPRGGHTLDAESDAEAESVPRGASNSGRDPIPLMPSRSDPPHKWEHLGDAAEIDEDGKRHAVVGGYYLDVIANLVCDAAGIDNAHWRGDWRPVAEWLRSKLPPDTVILPAIRAVASRPGYDPRSIRSLAYFDAAVREGQGGGQQQRRRQA